jgi:hypothetical protein
MNLGQSFRITVAVAACTAVAAQAALAAGEQKNMRPFTAQSHSKTTGVGLTMPATAVAADLAAEAREANGFDSIRAFAAEALERYLHHASAVTSTLGTGEPKNQGPFTRPVGRSA